nr:non-ribosomal peptide synthetase [Parachlamydia acanthamoebae]
MGASEASSFLFHEVLENHLTDQKIPVGKPCPNTTIYILDDNLNPVEKGCIGELCITGPRLVRGYFNDENLTSCKFVKNPFESSYQYSSKLYKTGDLVKLNQEGLVEYVGRKDFQIKIHGFRVNLNEIEDFLKEHSRVLDAIVLPLEEKLSAFVIIDANSKDFEQESLALRKYLIKKLPLFAVPGEFIFLEKFPVSQSGKLDRSALRNELYNPVVPRENYSPPETEIQKKLCLIWEQVLGYNQIGIDDAFIHLDGNSIKCVKILMSVNSLYSVQLKFSEFFVLQTIRKLSELIAERKTLEQYEIIKADLKYSSNTIPLSSGQKQLVFLEEVQAAPGLYNLFSAFEIEGIFKINLFEESLRSVLEEQFFLRAKLVKSKNEYFFEIQPVDKIFPDLGIQSVASRDEINQAALQPFELYKGPLFRTQLFSVNGALFLLFTVHHLIADEWSLQILYKNLSQHYGSLKLLNNCEEKIKNLYSDSIDRAEGDLNFWKKYLKDASSSISLPYDYLRPEKLSYLGNQCRIELPKGLSAKIYSFLQREKGTLFSTMLAAVQVFLHKWTGQNDLNIGIPSTLRSNKEFDEIVGYFVNALPVRSVYKPLQSFKDTYNEYRKLFYELKNNHGVSFDSIVRAISKTNQLNMNPIFQVWFSVEEAEDRVELEFDGILTKRYEIKNPYSKFDLSFLVKSAKGNLSIEIEYSSELFEETTITGLLERLQIFLDHLFSNNSVMLADVKLLQEEEEKEFVGQMTHISSETIKAVETMVKNITKLSSDKIAVIDQNGNYTYSYLNKRSDELAAYFFKSFPLQSVIAVSLSPSIFFIELILGLMKAGMCFLPIDTSIPKVRTNLMIRQSKALALISHTPGEMEECFILTQKAIESSLKSNDHVDFLEIPNSFKAYTIFTSGSTGEPKGVVLTRGNLANALIHLNKTLGVNANSSFLLNTMVSFDIFLLEMLSPLIAGGTVVIPDNKEHKDGEFINELINDFQINYLQATPSNWRLLLESGFTENVGLNLLCGGEKLDQSLANKLVKMGKSFWNMYGPTETTIWSSCKRIQENESISAGIPIGNTSILVLDSFGQIQPPGSIGEIVIGGNSVGEGYLYNPSLSAEKFVCNPFPLSESFVVVYKTGDKGFINKNKEIVCLGREDRQVKIHGHRIELDEIENVIRQCEYVHYAHVSTYIDFGGFQEVIAYIEPNKPLNFTVEALEVKLKDLLLSTLPKYMSPNRLIILEKFPLTPNKKIDFSKLPLPNELLEKKEQSLPPKTEFEKKIAQMWSEVLGQEEISPKDNFFNIGGHSLNAIRLRNLLAEKLNIELPAGILFQYPTIESFQDYIQNKYFKVYLPFSCEYKGELSEEQKGMLFMQKLYPHLPIYNISFPFIVKNMDKGIAKEAFKEMLKKHDSLNSVLEEHSNGTFLKPYNGPLPYKESISVNVEELSFQEASRLFDLTTEPPIRLLQSQIDQNTYLLQYTFHHVGIDRRSFYIFFKELNEFLSTGISKAKQFFQYADYVKWQRSQAWHDKQEAGLNFWKEYLESTTDLLKLPLDKQRPQNPSLKMSICSILLDASISSTVERFATNAKSTPFLVFLSLFFSSLYRHTYQNDIVAGTPVSMRHRREFEDILGCFVNVIPLRMHFNLKTSFLDVFENFKASFPDLLEHAQVPLSHIIRNMNGNNNSTIHPLFQVMFVFEERQNINLKIGNASFIPLACHTNFSAFDLIFIIKEKTSGYGLEIHYAQDLFEEKTVIDLLHRTEFLFNQLIKNPANPICFSCLLKEDEKKKLLLTMNNNSVPYPKKYIHAFFEENVRLQPDAIALVYEDKSITYHMLNVRSNQLAYRLIKKGVTLETFVGICMERSIEQIIALLAVLKAGGCFIPLDPSFPKERIDYIIEETNLELIIDSNFYETEFETIDLEKESNVDFPISERNLAYVIYTSGSTGKPKGVLIEHVGLCNLVGSVTKAENLKIRPGTRILQLASTTFDASIWDWIGALSLGATLIMREKSYLVPGNILADTLNEFKINNFNIPAGALELLPKQEIPSVQVMMVIGDVCSKKTVEYWSEKCLLYNGYGPTECTIGCTMKRMHSHQSHTDIGKALPNIQTYILDSLGELVPEGVIGELHIGGDCLARGYLKDASLTSEQFVIHAFSNDKTNAPRLYKTGDLVRYHHGSIEFIGRADNQYKIRGFRVDTSEIISILSEQPLVEKAMIRLFEKAENQKILYAYVVLNASFGKHKDILHTLKLILKKTLPAFMIPQDVLSIDKIPLTKNGKIDYGKLPLPVSQPQQEFQEEDPILNEITSLFKEVLGSNAISYDSDFFDNGGHSLLAGQLLFQLNERFKVNLLLKDLFDASTARSIGNLIKKHQNQDRLTSHPIKKVLDDTVDLTSAQNRLWILEVLFEQRGVYNVPLAFEVSNALNISALELSLAKVIERHENFRVRIFSEDGSPRQEILHSQYCKLQVQKICLKKGENLREICQKLSAIPFEMENEILIRCFLIDGMDDKILLFVFHHIIMDGKSINIFINDLNEFYNQSAQPLKQSIVYRDYIAFQNHYIAEEKKLELQNFWKNYLDNCVPILELPLDCPRVKQPYRANRHQFMLGKEQTQKIKKLSSQFKMTLNITCLSFFQFFLNKITMQNDVIVGTPFTLRRSEDWNKVMGYFINSLPIRTFFDRIQNFQDLMINVRESVLEVEENKDLQLDQIIKLLEIPRLPHITPLIQVWYVFENQGDYKTLDFMGTTFSHFSVPSLYAKFDLMLIVEERDNELSFIFEYAEELFLKETIEKWSSHFIHLLRDVLDCPSKNLKNYDFELQEMSFLL